MTDISTSVSQELSQTPYECSSLTQLSGGTANFVFRGILSQPLEDGTRTIIIKHGEDYIASNRDFKLSTERCVIEETILNALNDFPSASSSAENTTITVKTPRLFHFNRETNTQILEDLPDALDLKTFMRSPAISQDIPRELAISIGRAMGKWLHAFHSWVSDATQHDLVEQMGKSILMRDLKFTINYDRLVSMVEKYPVLLQESKPVFERVRDMAKTELGRNDGNGFGVIHGDFWTGNVLLPSTALNHLGTIPLFVTDWELCQCGARALDLGQMMAELYELKHFKDIDAGVWVIQGIVEGYDELSEKMAFRSAIHVGVHLICWGSSVPGWGTDEQVQEVVKTGRDFVVKGWEKDRSWFEGGPLKCLFSRST